METRYPRAERKALKGLMEGDRHEEHHERRARGDRYSHPDEDAVEEDAGLEEQTLQHQAPLLFRIRHMRHRRALGGRIGLPAVERHGRELVHIQLQIHRLAILVVFVVACSAPSRVAGCTIALSVDL